MLRFPACLFAFATAFVLLAACGEEEAGLQEPSTTLPSAAPTVPPIPADWPSYLDPGGRFSIRYPSDWFHRDGSLTSYDPEIRSGPGFRPEAVEVEVGYYEAVGSSGCGALLVDPDTGEGVPGAGATPVTLGGLPAWEVIREPGDPAVEAGLTRIHGISVIHDGFCFLVTGYYTQQNPVVATFDQIVSSFAFTP